MLAAANALAAGGWPIVEMRANTSACHELGGTRQAPTALWGRGSGDLRYLGRVASEAGCVALAAGHRNGSAPAERCQSSCWFERAPNASFDRGCYCGVAPRWLPFPAEGVASAALTWPCAGSEGCSGNGECRGGACACDAGWGGVRCGELALGAVEGGAMGIRERLPGGPNVSTWGAPVLWDERGKKWHAWASEMAHGCGINVRPARLGAPSRPHAAARPGRPTRASCTWWPRRRLAPSRGPRCLRRSLRARPRPGCEGRVPGRLNPAAAAGTSPR